MKYTRAIIDAIHDGALDNVETKTDPIFGFEVPTSCANVPSEVLIPRDTWSDPSEYDATANKLARLFRENFVQFEEGSTDEVIQAAPREQSEELSL